MSSVTMSELAVEAAGTPSQLSRSKAGGLIDRLGRRLLIRALREIRSGSIAIIEAGVLTRFGSDDSDLSCIVQVNQPGFWSAVAFAGSVGAGESYFDGDWECDDLAALVRILCRNRGVLDRVDGAAVAWRRPARGLLAWCRRNHRSQARRNIAAHYDLSNALFATFLDSRRQYSSAIYPSVESELDAAQLYKMDLLIERLDLRPEHHLLEIGTGWGGLARHIAERVGCRITTTTISHRQYHAARTEIRAAGLEDRVTVLDRDYRDLDGRYDRIVSVEMIEAVGHEYYPEFFATCRRLLRDDGLAVLQAITIADQHYTRARREVDYIKRHIFPGCCIPSLGELTRQAAAAGEMRLVDFRDYADDYARTLRSWRERFDAAALRISALGFDERFRRAWRFYFAYCEGGFAERALGLAHLVFAGPDRRSPSPAIAGVTA